MIQLDEKEISRTLEVLDSEKAKAGIRITKTGVVLEVESEKITETMVRAIKENWRQTSIMPSNHGGIVVTYRQSFEDLNPAKVAEQSLEKFRDSRLSHNGRKTFRGVGIPIPSCPVCQRPGRIILSPHGAADNLYIVVRHTPEAGSKVYREHSLTKYIEHMGFDYDELKAKLKKIREGVIKIDWAEKIPNGHGTITIMENGRQISSGETAYYLQMLRESAA